MYIFSSYIVLDSQFTQYENMFAFSFFLVCVAKISHPTLHFFSSSFWDFCLFYETAFLHIFGQDSLHFSVYILGVIFNIIF
jgi:hypothetical protein